MRLECILVKHAAYLKALCCKALILRLESGCQYVIQQLQHQARLPEAEPALRAKDSQNL